MEYLLKYNINKKRKSLINIILFLIAFLLNYSHCIDCPRDKPILKNNECWAIYCKPQDYENNICTISNPFIETQWLNNIHYFSSESISHICATSNEKGELFLIAQGFTSKTAGDKYIFGFYKDGTGLFREGNTNTQTSFFTIDLPDNKYSELFYSVEIGKIEYLLSTQTQNEMLLIDYRNQNYKSFTLDTNTFFSDIIFELKGDFNEKTFFTNYVFCIEKGNYNDCYLGLRLFKLENKELTIIAEKNDEILINSRGRINCFQNQYLYIECIYSSLKKTVEGKESYDRVLTLFNHKDLNVEYNIILQEDYNSDNTFDSSIHLNENTLVTGFSYPHDRNKIKLLLKKLEIITNGDNREISFENYLPGIDYININEDNKYIIERGHDKRNHMVKITEQKFAILLNEFSDVTIYGSFNKNLIILICNIFNNSKISIRHFKINFDLYNLIILEDLRGYTLNNFFGVLLEAGLNTTSFNAKAIFLTFGYVNSTYEELSIDQKLKENTTSSIIKVRDYISNIENNLFAYKFKGVKIISLPDRLKAGYFINNENEEEINTEDIYSIDLVLRFILVREIMIGVEFTIDFAAVVEEPNFDEMNINAERVDIYPDNNTESEREFYTPNILISRVIKYRFELSCYSSCNNCYKLSNNPNDQQCISCKNGYYFIEGTNNCYDELEGYYLNKQTNTFQKCHELCKTCSDSPNSLSMNCIECKYINSKFHPTNTGDCPSEEEDEGEEEEIIMPGGECPRSKPILIRNDFCIAAYCEPELYEDKTCVISNSIIKEQWMNNIQRFGEGNLIFANLDYGYDDELFLFAQKREKNNYENVIYAVDKYGQPFFYDKDNNKYYHFKTIVFPNDIFLENIKIVRNYENYQIFLISTQIEKEMYEINYEESNDYIHTFNLTSYSSQNLFPLKRNPEIYFTSFIYCQDDYNLKQCYPYLRLFKFESNNIITIIKEYIGEEIINSETNLICIENYEDYIQCVYSKVKENFNSHELALYNINNLKLDYAYEVELLIETEAFFDSMISLNDEAFVIAYSTEKNIIKVLIKYIRYDYSQLSPIIEDYVQDVPYIHINENDYYNFQDGLADRNSLCKIDDNKFAMLVNSFNDLKQDTYENPNIIIYIFTIFNNKKNISVRRYSINFKLYNMVNYGKVLGYNLGQFFGALIELSSPENKTIINSAFMTFGYVNTTEPSLIFDRDFIFENTFYSKSINFTKYIKGIENNLFGYKFLGVIILTLPDISMGGYFIKVGYGNNNEEKIYVKQILSVNSQIKLELKENYQPGNYSIAFAGAVEEPDYDKMNKFAEETILYPMDSKIDENSFYEPKMLIGRKFEYHFEIKKNKQPDDDEPCYPSCLTCSEKSYDDGNHLCLECKEGYYFKEDTKNCYDHIDKYYFFDEEKKIFSPCYIDCLTCAGRAIDLTYMNCLSCESEKKYYQKSKNCLNCPKYVDYMQVKCIDQIPEGYYLLDEYLGTIEQCHKLCKTCKSGPYTHGDTLHMNCETCLYTNKDYKPPSEGDCPSSEDKNEDEPIDGQCPLNKPILKEGKCQMIYCTQEEFEKNNCQIYNDYLKIQWFNNFHIFDEGYTTYIAYDINDKGDLFLLAQDKENPIYEQFLYGFSQDGRGILYDKSKEDYVSFKKISYDVSNYIEKIKYIEIDNKGYLLNILKENKIYLVDYNDNNVYSNSFLYSPFSFDKVMKIKNKNNVYLFDFIYCLSEISFDNCYIGFISYSINQGNEFKLDKTNTESLVKVDFDSKLTCYENSDNIIQCKYFTSVDEKDYNLKEQILEFFNINNFKSIQRIVLDKFSIDTPIFDSMIELKDNAHVIAYSIEPNIIQVIFKKLSLDENNKYNLENYLYNIPFININEDLEYDLDNGDPFRNSLFKISDDEFVMLLNDYKDEVVYSNLNSIMVIITFRIYNSNKNVILRHYKIDFTLYNRYIEGDIMGYKLNGFFGTLIELTSPKQKYLNNAAFLTFGYVNTTDDVSIEKGTNDLIIYKKNIKISDYILGIENNLFGYEFMGVKILSLPDEAKNIGYFQNVKKNNQKINVNDLIDINSELSFSLNTKAIPGNYYISFAGVVKEPEYEKMGNFSNKVVYYTSSGKPEYPDEVKILVGKEFRYNFAVNQKKCFDNCATCIRPSDNINEQDCLTCKEGFYFKDGTNNCYDKIEFQYYFNKETNTFSPCYRDCFTCTEKEIDSTHMNCLSCHILYKLYDKTKNCLKCSKYVNYEQTGCIDTIPEGYFLSDAKDGIIDRCYSLCKTCSSAAEKFNNDIHMHCDSCLSQDNYKLVDGNCVELTEDEKKAQKDKTNNEPEKRETSSNNYLVIWISILLVIIIIIVIGIIIYKKRGGKFGFKKTKNNTDYFNIGGKNIPFEDENNIN